MRSKVIGFLTINFLAFMFSGRTLAFCPEPNPPRICTEFFKAAAIFVGTVISVTEKQGKDDLISGWTYRLNVNRSYPGATKSPIEVFSSKASGLFPLQKNHTYLLFPIEHDGVLEIDGCGNGAESSEADRAIRQLDDLRRNQQIVSGGDIGGRIIKGAGGDGIAGINGGRQG
jgi:hypothetical protein